MRFKKRKNFRLGTLKYKHTPISLSLIRQLKQIQKIQNKKHDAKIPLVWISHHVEVKFKKK